MLKFFSIRNFFGGNPKVHLFSLPVHIAKVMARFSLPLKSLTNFKLTMKKCPRAEKLNSQFWRNSRFCAKLHAAKEQVTRSSACHFAPKAGGRSCSCYRSLSLVGNMTNNDFIATSQPDLQLSLYQRLNTVYQCTL
jgi:hypothetical protein